VSFHPKILSVLADGANAARPQERKRADGVIARSESDEAIQGQVLQPFERCPWIASLRSQ
jgi:hypothetical protein